MPDHDLSPVAASGISYTVFVSSPGGLDTEKAVVFEEIEALSKDSIKGHQPPLRVIAWPTDIAAGTAGYGQGVINRQTSHLDILVCMVGTRMGTPTPRANSGTEEEFDCAMEAILGGHPIQLLLLFSDIAVRPQAIDPYQLLLVRAFREKATRLGVLYHTFSDLNQLRHLFQVSLREAYHALIDRSSSTAYSPGLDLASPSAVGKTIKLPDRILSGPSTAPQWAASILIPLAEYRRQRVRLTWTMTTSSEHFRFGFKYYDSRETLYSAGSIQTVGQNILFHVGKNFDSTRWFATFYRSGYRLAANEILNESSARTSTQFELDISAADIVTFRMDGQILNEIFFPIDGLPALALLGWGDEYSFQCVVSDLTLSVNPQVGESTRK
jgi:hypothetical protein